MGGWLRVLLAWFGMGWVAGSNGNKANLSQLSLATIVYLLCLMAIVVHGRSSAKKKLNADFPLTSDGRYPAMVEILEMKCKVSNEMANNQYFRNNCLR